MIECNKTLYFKTTRNNYWERCWLVPFVFLCSVHIYMYDGRIVASFLPKKENPAHPFDGFICCSSHSSFNPFFLSFFLWFCADSLSILPFLSLSSSPFSLYFPLHPSLLYLSPLSLSLIPWVIIFSKGFHPPFSLSCVLLDRVSLHFALLNKPI